jgi:hypothetical protein
MKHLRKIFESSEDDKKYIEECFLDVSENPNFEVDDLIEVPFRDRLFDRQIYLKLHIELGKNLSKPIPVGSNIYIGMYEVDLEFLRNKNKSMLELFDDIEVAIERIKDRFQNAEIKIKSNRRDEIDILVLISKK